MNRPPILKRLTVLAVLLSLCSLCSLSPANPRASRWPMIHHGQRCSPDLRRLIQSSGSSTVNVVVQTTTTSQSGLIGFTDADCSRVVLVTTLSTLAHETVNVQANSVDVLAADPSVSYFTGYPGSELRAHHRDHWNSADPYAKKRSRFELHTSTVQASPSLLWTPASTLITNRFRQLGKIKVKQGFHWRKSHRRSLWPWNTRRRDRGRRLAAQLWRLRRYCSCRQPRIILRVLNSHGIGTVSGSLSALDWLMANKASLQH